MDVQEWSGLTRLGAVVERLRPELHVFRDERGTELFDLADAPRPDPDTPAPPRFLPEYDNLLVSHADRSRIVADADRGRITVDGREIVGTVLVGGFAGGTWKIHRKGGRAVLAVAPFARLARAGGRGPDGGGRAAPRLHRRRCVGAGGADRGGPARLAAPPHWNRLCSFSTARLLEPSVSSAWNTPFTPIVEPLGGGAEVSLITVRVPVPSFTW